MQKFKRSKFVIVAIVIFSMVAMYGYMPVAEAANTESVSILLGDSDIGATATSTITFNLVATLPADGYVRANFTSADFTGFSLAGIDCGVGGVASTTDEIVDCTYAGGLDTADHTFAVRLTNGAAGKKDVVVTAYTSLGAEIESSDAAAFVISSVSVTANVDATLTFTISGTSSGAVINGATTNVDTSADATALAFGTLEGGSANRKTLGQDLTVSTNATGGYTVTVIQDQLLRSGAGAIIDPFVEGAVQGTPGTAWASPVPELGTEETYGHIGMTMTDDDSLIVASGNFIGLAAGALQTVMENDGPADGITADVGYASVAYSVEITDLQEAGDYDAALTYVCTPIY